MNFFEAMRALENRQPVRVKGFPECTMRVEDMERQIDGKSVKKFVIKVFNSGSGKGSQFGDFPREARATFAPDIIDAEWELGDPL